MIGSILLVLVAILSQLMFVTAFVPLNVDILSHELFKSLHRTWRTKSLSCLFLLDSTIYPNILLVLRLRQGHGEQLKNVCKACSNSLLIYNCHFMFLNLKFKSFLSWWYGKWSLFHISFFSSLILILLSISI